MQCSACDKPKTPPPEISSWPYQSLAMQVVAEKLAPISALAQNLVMSALFQPFEALCSEATAEIDEVNAQAACMYALCDV